MEITNIKRFSEVYNNLREYFNKIEPCIYKQESLFPQIAGSLTIKKGFNASDWDIPCSSSTFKSLYDSFIDGLSNAVLDYSQSTVMTMLKVHFSSVRAVFEDSLADVFKYDREDLIELIESFNEATKLLYNLINDSGTIYEFDFKILGYYDSFKEEAKEKREKLISETQTKKKSYTGAAIVNETIRDFGNEEAIQSIQGQAITSTKGNKIQQTFKDIIQSDDKEKLLKRLHYLIDDKGGAAVGAVLLKTYLDHHLTQIPTQGMYKSEFELIGTWQAIQNYMNENEINALDKANKIIIFD